MESIFEKIAKKFAEHPIRNIFICFVVLIFVPTGMIHLIYSIPAPCEILRAKIPAGSLLAYIGTVLTFCATFTLSMTVYLSNKKQEKINRISQNGVNLLIDDEDVFVTFPKEEGVDICFDVTIISQTFISYMKMNKISVEETLLDKNKKEYSECFQDNGIALKYVDSKTVRIPLRIRKKDIISAIERNESLDVKIECETIFNGVKSEFVIIMNFTNKVVNVREGIRRYMIKNAYALPRYSIV